VLPDSDQSLTNGQRLSRIQDRCTGFGRGAGHTGALGLVQIRTQVPNWRARKHLRAQVLFNRQARKGFCSCRLCRYIYLQSMDFAPTLFVNLVQIRPVHATYLTYMVPGKIHLYTM
jgi:hypothetical protein